MNIAYVRVSTDEQNEERQKVALEKYGIDKWFVEKASAKDMNRQVFTEMTEYLRSGDVLYVDDFSRLARNTLDLLNFLQILNNKGVRVVSRKENFDINSPTGRLLLTIMAAIHEYERAATLERQREGIEIAKAEGKYKGRKMIEVEDQKLNYLWKKYKEHKISKSGIAQQLNITRPTLDRILKDKELV